MDDGLLTARRRTGAIYGARGSRRVVEGIQQGGYYVFEGDMVLGDDASLAREDLAWALEVIRRSSAEGIDSLGGSAEVRAAIYVLRQAIEASSGPHPGVVINDPKRRWPSGVVTYTITAKNYEDRIREAMMLWTAGTHIEFRERTNEKDWVDIRPGPYTRSQVGFQGGTQFLEINDGLSALGNIAHELGHTLGLFHEQTRTDRDKFLEVVWSNIAQPFWSQFTTSPLSEDVGEYDYDSIMHYPMVAFAIDPSKPTLKPRKDGVSIGQRNGPSARDLATVREMYPEQIV